MPGLDTAHGEATRIFVLSVQSQLPNGSWTNLTQSSWYGTGSETYESCTALPPGGTEEFGGMVSNFGILKEQIAKLGVEPTIRLFVMFFCRQPDGKVITTTFPSEGFSLRLPAPSGN